jgi:hypothetical protein
MNKLKLLVFLTLLLCRFSLSAQQSSKIYGIIIKGGHVIDPKNNIDELMDIALMVILLGLGLQQLLMPVILIMNPLPISKNR